MLAKVQDQRPNRTQAFIARRSGICRWLRRAVIMVALLTLFYTELLVFLRLLQDT